jgi:hypothetical protein
MSADRRRRRVISESAVNSSLHFTREEKQSTRPSL